jgi:hypothetical protein
MYLLSKILITTGSAVTIGFGLWHFFVPKIWNWYTYINPDATELTIAVRNINVFFSLCLVLFGIVNIIFINGNHSNRFSIIVMLSATSVLWITRSVLQLVYPQGSFNPAVQYGMLAMFILVTICFLISLSIIIFQKSIA